MIVEPDFQGRTGQQGHLDLGIEKVAGMSTVVQARAGAPLKVLVPWSRGASAWAFVSSLGGGMVSGDRHELTVKVGSGATAFVGTQSSTKIYRPSRADSPACMQRVKVQAGADSWMVWAPDPVQPFAGARYRQSQTFLLQESSNLVCVDSVTAGRSERGEQWHFDEYRSRTEVYVGARRRVLDSLQLVSEPGTVPVNARMGSCQAVAVVLLTGPRVASAACELLEQISSIQPHREDPVRCCGSPIPGGALLRVASTRVEAVRHCLAAWLSFLSQPLGDNPWVRKW